MPWPTRSGVGHLFFTMRRLLPQRPLPTPGLWPTCGLALILAGLLTPWAGRSLLWHFEQNPILRGQLLAEELGCFNCHRPHAGREIPNPGSRWGTVPRFQGGNAFMYAPTADDIAEFIRWGAPRAWLDDPVIQKRLAAQLVRMPAYDDRLDARELADLTAFVAATEGVALQGGDAAAPGRELARQHGCWSCHGVEGAGGQPNPGSLGGFIPGFLGRNFTDLVADEQEFREWVKTGTLTRLGNNPLIRFFWQRQEIQMPAYADELSDAQITELWRWVQAMRG